MSRPQVYNRSFSFSSYQSSNPSTPLPGGSLDGELNAVKAATDSLSTNLSLIQRADGVLANGSVGRDQLAASLQVGFLPPTIWVPNTPYLSSPANTVFTNNKFYSCLVSHTSSASFAADLAAGDWVQIADLTGIPLVTANQIAITPAGGIVLTDVQSAMYGLDGRITASAAAIAAGFASTLITDSTAVGRALMTAVNADAALAIVHGPTTGAVQLTIRQTSDPGWLMMNDSTIGPVGSGAAFASGTAWPLYEVLWDNITDARAPVSTGRGASALDDWNAGKTITLLRVLGRALAVAGGGAGLSARELGQYLGEETFVIGQANLPNITLATDIPAGQGSHNHVASTSTFGGSHFSANPGATPNILIDGLVSSVDANTLPAMVGTTPLGGSGVAVTQMQPTSFLNAMIKL
jgi:hypothetical protein